MNLLPRDTTFSHNCPGYEDWRVDDSVSQHVVGELLVAS